MCAPAYHTERAQVRFTGMHRIGRIRCYGDVNQITAGWATVAALPSSMPARSGTLCGAGRISF